MKAQKQTIIMIHGFRGTHHGMQLIAEQLPEYVLIIPDLPGFAEGDKLDSYDLASYVQWLHDFVKKQKLADLPIILGHSFGSIIASAYAAKYPETIAKLVLVNPIGAPALEGPRALLTKLALFYYWAGSQLPPKLGSKWFSIKPAVAVVTITMSKTKDKKLRRYIHDQHYTYFSLFHDLRSLSESFRTSINHNVRQVAAHIPIPTLLIVGDKDDITPLSKQKELVKLFPDAQLHVIKNVGHLTHYETPDQVADAIKNFI